LEFGYCFDVRFLNSVSTTNSYTRQLRSRTETRRLTSLQNKQVSNRAFFPLYLHLYVVQFLLLPLLTRSPSNFLATFLGNTLYLSALTYYTYITFLGYNALPFLHNTELLLLPILVFAVLWLVSLIAGWGVVMQGRSVEGLFWGV
jgi:hypothetical protein